LWQATAKDFIDVANSLAAACGLVALTAAYGDDLLQVSLGSKSE